MDKGSGSGQLKGFWSGRGLPSGAPASLHTDSHSKEEGGALGRRATRLPSIDENWGARVRRRG